MTNNNNNNNKCVSCILISLNLKYHLCNYDKTILYEKMIRLQLTHKNKTNDGFFFFFLFLLFFDGVTPLTKPKMVNTINNSTNKLLFLSFIIEKSVYNGFHKTL